MIRKNLIFVGICLLIFTMIPAFIYMINFKGLYISDLSSDWGTFGDFIGGITNPIIGIVNVLVLVYLTLKISEIDNNNKIKEQENQINDKLDEIRLIGFKELNSLFLKTMRILASIDQIEEADCVGLKFEFHSIIHPYIDLFKTFNDESRINELGNRFLKISQFNGNNDMKSKFMVEFSILLCDMRNEIKKITYSNAIYK
jgi:hypothetical protein